MVVVMEAASKRTTKNLHLFTLKLKQKEFKLK